MTSQFNYLGPRRTGIHISRRHATEPGKSGRQQQPPLVPHEPELILDSVLAHYLNIDKETRNAVIEEIRKHGRFRVFGYGSLIRSPAYRLDEQYFGHVEGWERVSCKDRYLRGRPGDLGITMGALPTHRPDARLHGMVQEIKVDLSKGPDRIIGSILEFARRETSLNPIYRYKMVDVVTKDHGIVQAIVCMADVESHLFAGHDNPGQVGKGLTFLEQAAVIATASGVPGATASLRSTDLDYWRFALHCQYRAGFVDPYVKERVEAANAMRAVLARAHKSDGRFRHAFDLARLEKLEMRGLLTSLKERLDRRAFRCNPRLARLTAGEVMQLRKRACVKMGLFDPLRPAERARMEKLYRELNS